MIWKWWRQLGEWNPQLWREVKGRFQRRNVLLVAVMSIVGQILLLLFHYRQEIARRDYCKSGGDFSDYCQNSSEGLLWWFDVFHSLTWIGVLLLLILGSYLLIKDLAREARRGTLLLVRLSPQTAQSILLGKLLGVPSLLYVAVALALPLHLWAAFHIGLPVLTLLNIYALSALVCGFAYTFALLCVLEWELSATILSAVLPISLIAYLLLHRLWTLWGDSHREALQLGQSSFELPGNAEVMLLAGSALIAAITCGFWCSCVLQFSKPFPQNVNLDPSSLPKPRRFKRLN